MIEKIKQTFHDKKAYDSLQNRNHNLQASAKKEIQWPFCLMNIHFLDKFVSDFSSLGDVASRMTLTKGKAANDEVFWVGVQRAFTEEENNNKYNQLKIYG
jgi:hypothetical protein